MGWHLLSFYWEFISLNQVPLLLKNKPQIQVRQTVIVIESGQDVRIVFFNQIKPGLTVFIEIFVGFRSSI
jgi:hypothetical protein